MHHGMKVGIDQSAAGQENPYEICRLPGIFFLNDKSMLYQTKIIRYCIHNYRKAFGVSSGRELSDSRKGDMSSSTLPGMLYKSTNLTHI